MRRTSRRGAMLLLFGAIYLAIGGGYLTPLPGASPSTSYVFAARLMPLPLWGLLWIAAGTVGIVTARWPAARESWGFQVLSAMALLWGSMAVMSALFYGEPRGLLAGVIFYAFGGALLIASGMVDPK